MIIDLDFRKQVPVIDTPEIARERIEIRVCNVSRVFIGEANHPIVVINHVSPGRQP
jgi:hypothetical protein